MTGKRWLVGCMMVLVAAAWSGADEEAISDPAPFKAQEDIVYGHKDGLAMTLDVLTPEENAKGIGIILVSSGGWKSGKSNVPGRELNRRKHEHWIQGLLKGGYTLFVVRHGSTPRYFVPEMVEDIRRSVRLVRTSRRAVRRRSRTTWASPADRPAATCR